MTDRLAGTAANNRNAARVGRPRGSNKEVKLAQILLAARRQFAEKGYAQTTFKDVGRAVGMTHAALYSYFSSKLDLYAATLLDAQSVLLPEYLRALAECTTLRERFDRILMASAAAADRDLTVTGFLAAVPIEMRRHPELQEELLKRSNGLYQTLSAMFEEAKQSGELNPELSTENLITAFFGGALGVSLFHYGMHASTRLTDAMAIFAHLVDQGFATGDIAPAAASSSAAGNSGLVRGVRKPAKSAPKA
ncbi:MAG: TetR/AcrR family transcriptional regulator [Sterolibacterium sp.]|nr:TetR/AcrR family transcriptional regulator [Sterolibacterium sp.]